MSYYVQFTYLINQLERLGILKSRIIYLLLKTTINWQFFPYWPYWSLPPGGLVSPSGGFASLLFDQAVPKNSQHHLADWNTICILHQSDCAWLRCLSSQYSLLDISYGIIITREQLRCMYIESFSSNFHCTKALVHVFGSFSIWCYSQYKGSKYIISPRTADKLWPNP